MSDITFDDLPNVNNPGAQVTAPTTNITFDDLPNISAPVTGNPILEHAINNYHPSTMPSPDTHMTMPGGTSRWMENNMPNAFIGMADTGLGLSRLRNNLGIPGGTDADVLNLAEQNLNKAKNNQSGWGQFKGQFFQPGMYAAMLTPEISGPAKAWPWIAPALNAMLQGGTMSGINSLLSSDKNAAVPGEVDTLGNQMSQAGKSALLGIPAGVIGQGIGYGLGKGISRLGDAASYGITKLTGMEPPDLVAGLAGRFFPNSGEELPAETQALQDAAKNLGLDISEGDSNAVIKSKINDAMDKAASELGPDALPTNPTDWGLDKNVAMSKQYGKNLLERNRLYGLRDAEGLDANGNPKMIDVTAVGKAAKDAAGQIQDLYESTGLTDVQKNAVGKLMAMANAMGGKSTSTILDSAGQPMATQARGLMPINDFIDVPNSLRNNFNLDSDDYKFLKPVVEKASEVVKDAIPTLYPKYAALDDAAKAFTKSNIFDTFTDNPAIKPFWTPDDYVWTKSNGLTETELPWREKLAQNAMQNPQASTLPPPDITTRAQSLLDNITNAGHLQTLQKALPPEETQDLFKTKLAQLLDKSSNNGEYDINGLVKLLNPNQLKNPDYGDVLTLAGSKNQNKLNDIYTVAQNLKNKGYTGNEVQNVEPALAGNVAGAAVSPYGKWALAKNVGKGLVGKGYTPLGSFANELNQTPFDNTLANVMGNVWQVAKTNAAQKSANRPVQAPPGSQTPVQRRVVAPAVPPATPQAPISPPPPTHAPTPPPAPAAAPQNNSLLQTITPIAQHFGNDPTLLNKIAMAESGGDPNAKNPNSTALGLYQFTAPTWRSLVDRFGSQYGISYRDRVNPVANTIMANILTSQNKQSLQGLLGRQPNNTEIYMAHVLGPQRAASVISNMDNHQLSAARIAPDAAQSNPHLFFNKGLPVTPKGLYQKLDLALNGGI